MLTDLNLHITDYEKRSIRDSTHFSLVYKSILVYYIFDFIFDLHHRGFSNTDWLILSFLIYDHFYEI